MSERAWRCVCAAAWLRRLWPWTLTPPTAPGCYRVRKSRWAWPQTVAVQPFDLNDSASFLVAVEFSDGRTDITDVKVCELWGWRWWWWR